MTSGSPPPDAPAPADLPAPAGGVWRRVVTVVALLALGSAVTWGLRQTPLDQLIEDVRGLGVWAPVAVIGMYVVTCLAFVPGTLLTLACGMLFGVLEGTVVATIGANLGANAAFVVARFAGRRGLEEKILAKHGKLSSLDDAVKREGLKIVLLTRLSPVFPFNALNYAYGLTGVRWSHYGIGTLVGMLVGTAAFVYLGSVFGLAAAGREEKSALEWGLVGMGLVATFVLAVFLARTAKRAMGDTFDAEEPSS